MNDRGLYENTEAIVAAWCMPARQHLLSMLTITPNMYKLGTCVATNKHWKYHLFVIVYEDLVRSCSVILLSFRFPFHNVSY